MGEFALSDRRHEGSAGLHGVGGSGDRWQGERYGAILAGRAQPVEAQPHGRAVAVQGHLNRLAGQGFGLTVQDRLDGLGGAVAGALGPAGGIARLPSSEFATVRNSLSYHRIIIGLSYDPMPENTG